MGIARSVEAAEAAFASRARASSAASTPTASPRNAARAMELLAEVAGAAWSPRHGRRVPAARRAAAHPRCARARSTGVLGTDLTDAEVLDALAPARDRARRGAATRSTRVAADVPPRPRARDRPRRGGGPPGRASTSIGRTVPEARDQVGGLTHRPARPPARRRRARRRRPLRGRSRSRSSRPPTSSGPVRRRPRRCRSPTRSGPRSRCCAPRCSPACCGGGVQPARGHADVALFELGHVFLAGATDGSAPGRARARRRRARRHGPAGAGRARPPGRRVRRGRRRRCARSTRSESPTSGSSPHAVPGMAPGARPARWRSVDVAIGTVGEIARDVVRGTRDQRARGRASSSTSTAHRRRPRRDRTFVTPSPYPPPVIDLAFVVDDDVLAASIAATLRTRPAVSLEEVAVFDEFRRDAARAGRRSVAFRLRFRAPDRTLTDAEVASCANRPSTPSPAPTAPSSAAERLPGGRYAPSCIVCTMAYRAAVVGGSGYTGAELLRLLAGHPEIEVVHVTADSNAGAAVADALPVARRRVPGARRSSRSTPADARRARPRVRRAAARRVAARRCRSSLDHVGHVVDLGADFRLPADVYATLVRRGARARPTLLDRFAYGLPELFRDDLAPRRATSRRPGCYPTAAALALAPLLAHGLVEPTGIIVDAVSGVSGRGPRPVGARACSPRRTRTSARTACSRTATPREIEHALAHVARRSRCRCCSRRTSCR